LTPIVIDASVAMAIVLGEPRGEAIVGRLRTELGRGSRLLVPAHFWLEVTSALRTRHQTPGSRIVEMLHELDTFEIGTITIERPHLLLVVDAMERHGLTGYDAMYLVLAESLGASLATFDDRLLAAAGPLAIGTDDPHRLSEPAAPYERDVTWPAYAEAGRFLAKLRADAIRDREAARS